MLAVYPAGGSHGDNCRVPLEDSTCEYSNRQMKKKTIEQLMTLTTKTLDGVSGSDGSTVDEECWLSPRVDLQAFLHLLQVRNGKPIGHSHCPGRAAYKIGRGVQGHKTRATRQRGRRLGLRVVFDRTWWRQYSRLLPADLNRHSLQPLPPHQVRSIFFATLVRADD